MKPLYLKTRRKPLSPCILHRSSASINVGRSPRSLSKLLNKFKSHSLTLYFVAHSFLYIKKTLDWIIIIFWFDLWFMIHDIPKVIFCFVKTKWLWSLDMNEIRYISLLILLCRWKTLDWIVIIYNVFWFDLWLMIFL